MTWKVSIHDSLRHKYTVSLPDLWCKVRRVFIRASLSEKLLHPTQNKAIQFPLMPLDVYFLPTQTAQLPHGVFSTRICASNYFASTDNSNLANLSGKLLHPRKAKRYSFHPYRLMFIFSNADGTTAAGRFLYSNLCIESLRQYRQFQPCKPIRKAATSTKSKAVQFSPIPLDVYFFPTQTARLPQGVFSTRICASNRSANADT